MDRPTVTLLRSGTHIVLEPTTPEIRKIVEPLLWYTARELQVGYKARRQYGAVKFTRYACFVDDHRDRIGTSLGFYRRITDALESQGYRVRIKDLMPPEQPEVFVPQWDRLAAAGVTLREGQDQFLVKLAATLQKRLPACFDCAPGFGKSTLIGFTGLLYPQAKIHVVAKQVPVLRDRIYPELCGMLPGVGIVGGGKNIPNRRVQLYTVDSLHKSTNQCDILIADEAHSIGADNAAAMLGRYTGSVNIGLSATFNKRADGKDTRVEAIFGPVIHRVGYEEAVDKGLVVPLEVSWSDVVMDFDPTSEAADDDFVNKKRFGVWRNQTRNQIIACDVRKESPETQVLVPCETLEHALHLKKLLPEFTLVYSETGWAGSDIRYFRQLGVWPEGESAMTPERKMALTKAYERGQLKKVICTTVWNVGVSFNFLELVARADGGSSAINDTQIPGRAARLGKALGRVRDYKDQFNKGFRRRALARAKNYAGNGWVQHNSPLNDRGCL